MKIKKIFGVCFLFGIFSSAAIAPASQMNEEIVKIIEQLNAIKPMIHRASQFQDKRDRHQVHFYSWTDKDGNKHKQIPVKGAEWDGGNITLQAWDKEKKEAINLVYLKPDNELTSTPELKVDTAPVTKEDDGFPF